MDKIEMPRVKDVALQLQMERDYLQRTMTEEDMTDADGFVGVDVRLQVWPDGAWIIHTGSSDYDQDHRGFWGASCIGYHDTNEDTLRTAAQLISEAAEQEAECHADA